MCIRDRPETTPECWSGRCVPAGYCDVISECGLCPADTLCAEIKSCDPQSVRCEPLPLACAGVPSCECIGDQICANLGICGINEGVLDCYCPL